MAAITAALVKEVRELSGAGMMDCKKALTETDGDVQKAVVWLQKNSLIKSAKAATKIAADGAVVAEVAPDGLLGVLVEVNCQTDFVARGEEFQAFAKKMGREVLGSNVQDVAELEGREIDGKSIKSLSDELTAKSGEKHAVRRFVRYHAEAGKGVVTAYIHHGARLGVLLELETAKGPTPEAKALADQLVLQIASMGSRYPVKAEVPADDVAKQREIFAAQMQKEVDDAVAAHTSAKAEADAAEEVSDAAKAYVATLEKNAQKLASRPAAANEKILDGKVAKWLTEIVLADQESIVDEHGKKTIGAVLADFSTKNGATRVKRFARYELGEGVDKGVAKDFASEVAEMAARAQQG